MERWYLSNLKWENVMRHAFPIQAIYHPQMAYQQKVEHQQNFCQEMKTAAFKTRLTINRSWTITDFCS